MRFTWLINFLIRHENPPKGLLKESHKIQDSPIIPLFQYSTALSKVFHNPPFSLGLFTMLFYFLFPWNEINKPQKP